MSFFSAQPHGFFLVPRDWMHGLAVLVLFTAIILVIIFRNKIAKWKYEQHLLYAFTFLAIAMETAFRLWKHFTQEGTFLTVNLPLHLCAISLTLCWILVFTKKEWAFKLVYFYSIGAMISMFVADCNGFGINHFRYYQYFFIHGYIVFIPIYFIAVHKYKIVFKDLLMAIGVLVLIFALVMPLDYFIGANYMYLMDKPPVASPLDLMGPWPNYILGMTLLALTVFTVFYLPWFFRGMKNKKREVPKDKNDRIAA